MTPEEISGVASDDTLTGNSADNKLNGGAGANQMQGAGNNDTYVVDNPGDIVTEDANAGTDVVQTGITYTLPDQCRQSCHERRTSRSTPPATELSNTLYGSSAANVLSSEGETDRLIAYGGNDTLIGGAGDDTMPGAAGQTCSCSPMATGRTSSRTSRTAPTSTT